MKTIKMHVFYTVHATSTIWTIRLSLISLISLRKIAHFRKMEYLSGQRFLWKLKYKRDFIKEYTSKYIYIWTKLFFGSIAVYTSNSFIYKDDELEPHQFLFCLSSELNGAHGAHGARGLCIHHGVLQMRAWNLRQDRTSSREARGHQWGERRWQVASRLRGQSRQE